MVSMVQPATSFCRTHINVIVTTPCLSVPAKAPIDSGAAGKFISHALLNTLQLPHRVNSHNLRIHDILGQPLG